MKKYKEIEKLKSIYHKHNIQIKRLKRKNSDGFLLVELIIKDQSWKIYIDDEYGDYNDKKPLIALYLILFALDVYHSSWDYFDWCNQNKINSSNAKWLNYFETLEKTYTELKLILGDLDPCIDSFDFQVRNGVVDALFALEVS